MARYDSDRYKPSVDDVFTAKQELLKITAFPVELIDTIIDFAEYWPHTTTIRSGAEMMLAANTPRENHFLLRSYPLGYIPGEGDPTECPMKSENQYPTIPPRLWTQDVDSDANTTTTQEVIDYWTRNSLTRGEFPCRKVVFTLKSHDQGWGGQSRHRGTFEGSYSWFEVGRERLCTVQESQLPPKTPRQAPGTNATPRGFFTEAPDIPGEALFPHFKLSLDIPARPDPPHTSTPPTAASTPIICSVKTITPIPRPGQTRSEDNPHAALDFNHPLLPTTTALQHNRVSIKAAEEFTITWASTDDVTPDSLEAKELIDAGRGGDSGDGEYVRSMKIGDVVTVWGKARFPGWVNFIEHVQIDVYWAV